MKQVGPQVGEQRRPATATIGATPGKQTLVQLASQHNGMAPNAVGALNVSPSGAPSLAGTASTKKPTTASDRVAVLIELLMTKPITKPDAALDYLRAMSMTDAVTTISGVADCGYLPQLVSRSRSGGADQPRLLAAIGAVELACAPQAIITFARLNAVGAHFDQLSDSDQMQLFAFLLTKRGVNVTVTDLLEGVIALRNAKGDPAAPEEIEPGAGDGSRADADPPGDDVPSNVAAAASENSAAAGIAAPPQVGPGQWAPPGDQPIPCYVGRTVHERVGKHYQENTRPDAVRTNNFTISHTLNAMAALGKTTKPIVDSPEHGLMPDIVNLDKLFLYEIKPAAALAAGVVKASMYIGIFDRAGVAVVPGPSGAPGTTGAIPAPHGVAMFWSPAPGVIVYSYRKGKLVPVPARSRARQAVPQWRLVLKPLTRDQQQMIVTTTLGGATLVVLMLLLSPLGA